MKDEVRKKGSRDERKTDMARFTAKDYLAQVKALFEGAKKSLDEADYAAFVEDAETFVETEAAEVFDDEEEADEGAPDVPEV